jgi:hypothetical protein
MSVTTSPELFINVKRVPDKTSKEYTPFFREERKKIKNGITINGVRFPGWLYWHINHWMINIDSVDPENPLYVERISTKPYLRDNEWMISEHIDRAERERKGLLILGSRQLGKSEFGASYMGRRCIIFQNSQNVVAGLSTPDLNLLLSKINKGFTSIHPFFRPLKIKDNWKEQVTLGYKTASGSGDREIYSELLIRNLDGGKNTENLAGPTTSSLLLDEIGKGDFLESWIAAKPALMTPFGFRGSPIFVGTSGSFDKSEDLQKFRANLETHNFIQVEMKDTEGKKIYFVPGYQASMVKRRKIRLSRYLRLGPGSELDQVPIHVVLDPQEAINGIKAQRKHYEETLQFDLLKKETMYYPLNEEELFLIDDADNIFADVRELCRQHLTYLESIDNDEEWGWLTRGQDGKPKWIPAGPGEVPIQEFPTGERENKDAPIIIWDRPMLGQEFGVLHVAGSDPYNQDESEYSPSLGTIYIYRRTYDPLRGEYQNTIVACYAARPKNISKWRDQVRLLMEWYGATCLPENEEPGFIRWFDEKNIGHYLEDGIQLAKEINPNTKVKRNKGLSASTANIRYGNGLVKTYLSEDLIMGQDTNGDNIIKQGVIRIKDKVLLKEVIAYKPPVPGKKGVNVDRIVAFRHALILAAMKDKYFPIARLKVQLREEKQKPKSPRGPFSVTPKGAFGQRSMKSPFRM